MGNLEKHACIFDADFVKPKPNSKPNSKVWKVYRRRPKNSMAIWF